MGGSCGHLCGCGAFKAHEQLAVLFCPARMFRGFSAYFPVAVKQCALVGSFDAFSLKHAAQPFCRLAQVDELLNVDACDRLAVAACCLGVLLCHVALRLVTMGTSYDRKTIESKKNQQKNKKTLNSMDSPVLQT
jgi:hypothetical protein